MMRNIGSSLVAIFFTMSLWAMEQNPLGTKEIFAFMALISLNKNADVKKLVDSDSRYLSAVDPIAGMNGLIRAAHEGNIELIEYFHTKGLDINSKEKTGFTALHRCVASNRPESITCLLRFGANKDIPNDDELTPAQLASTWDKPEMAKLFQ